MRFLAPFLLCHTLMYQEWQQRSSLTWMEGLSIRMIGVESFSSLHQYKVAWISSWSLYLRTLRRPLFKLIHRHLKKKPRYRLKITLQRIFSQYLVIRNNFREKTVFCECFVGLFSVCSAQTLLQHITGRLAWFWWEFLAFWWFHCLKSHVI